MSEALVLVERDEPIAVVTLNRPDRMNALSEPLMEELVAALGELDRDEKIRCIVLAGSDKAFAAGADIGEMATASAMDMLYARRVERWDAIRKLWTPLVAAVSGYCLGGGNELAMSCDLIVASETAKFGQPETSLGIIPGAGGTQRLTRAVGKGEGDGRHPLRSLPHRRGGGARRPGRAGRRAGRVARRGEVGGAGDRRRKARSRSGSRRKR